MITNSQEYLSSRIRSLESVSFDHQSLPQSHNNTTSPSINIWASEQRKLKPSTRKEPTFSQESQSIADVVASTKTPDVLPIQKVNLVSLFLNSLTQTDKPQNPQFIAPVIKPQKDCEEFNNVESFEHLFMAELENAESTVQFDAEDYEEHQENPNQETPTEFPKSDIKQYFTFDDIPPSKWRERSIEMLTWCTAEFHNIYLEKHYDRMSQRFYCLNGVDDVNLKQLILNALAKLCNQKKFLTEFERTGKRHGTTCDDKYLQIKCKDKSSCDCTHTKKKFHSKRFSSLSGKPRFSRRSNKKCKFIRKKKQRGRTSEWCFICQKRGHFVRNCPDKKRSQALIQDLNQVEPVDLSGLESLYSLDDEPNNSVLCTIAYSDFSSDKDSDSDSLESDFDFGVHMINPIPHVLPIQEDPPL
ncbi:putative zinc finger, CCHC-type containing protein, partial [Tanacetum coccineum]